MLLRIIIFLIINFAALGLGSLFTTGGVISDWYMNLNKAPWTPPGWVFGASWFIIMVCFSLFMAFIWDKESNKQYLIGLFVIQWILNVIWNPVFFNYHQMGLGLILISALTILVWFFMLNYRKLLSHKTWLIAPYAIWLCIATSLNLYAYLYN